jgi:glycosyltransferase involved in cell wall biosynthesis
VILYTLCSLDVGGAELRSLELIRELKARRPDLDLLLYVTTPHRGPLEGPFRALGIRVVHAPRGLAGVWYLRQTCARFHVSILHANADTVSGFYCFGAALAGVKTRIAHFRSTAPWRFAWRDRLIHHTGRLLLRLFATRVVGVCDGARAHAGVRRRRWRTIYNGIHADFPPLSPSPQSGPRSLLFLGRIHPDKDYLKAVDIFDRLRATSHLDVSLHFVGTGAPAELAKLHERIGRSRYRGSIAVHGPAQDVRAHLRRADALLLPSLREGLPGSVLEALSEGVPVIASNLPGLREIQRASAGVRLVCRDADSLSWVPDTEKALTTGRCGGIRLAFQRSPFQFDRYVRDFERLWRLGPAAE